MTEGSVGSVEGAVEGASEGSSEGSVTGSVDGSVEDSVEGSVEGSVDGSVEGSVTIEDGGTSVPVVSWGIAWVQPHSNTARISNKLSIFFIMYFLKGKVTNIVADFRSNVNFSEQKKSMSIHRHALF